MKEGRGMPVRSHHVTRAPLTDAVLEPLVRRTLERRPRAWQTFWEAVDPRIEEIAGRWRVTSRLSNCWDDRRNIVVRVMGRLGADGFQRFGLLHQVLLRGEEAGWPWISAVTRRTALNYARRHAENLGARPAEEGPRWAA